jgi:hypothetical protein
VNEDREQRMCLTPIEVINADEVAGTIRIVVVGWQIDEPITVPLMKFAMETGLGAAELVAARWLEAEANVFAFSSRELRFQNIKVAPPLPAGFMGGPIPAASEESK